MALTLFKGDKEKRTVFEEWTAERCAVLSASERRFIYRRKGITRLETLVSQKAEDVSAQIVGASLGHHIHDAAR